MGLKHEQLEAYLTKVLAAVLAHDKHTLRQCGQQDGFINDRIRQLVWPVLLDCDGRGYALYDDEAGFPSLDDRDNLTIQQDVRRSFTRFPDLEEKGRGELEERLERTITRVLRIHPRLHYVQGFHDLAEVLILVSADDLLACQLLHRMSLVNVRDMLLPSLDPVLNSLDLIPAILQKVDKRLYRHVLKAVRPPHFAASAVMTWFSHELDDMDHVATIFDFLLSSPATMIFYLISAIIINSKPEILAPYDPDEDDFAVIYTRLISIFRKPCSITIIFPLTLRLYKQVPPTSLWIYDSLSPWSSYKRPPPEHDWLGEGDVALERATEEQYTKKGEETATETTRRLNTLSRQEKAGILLRRVREENKGAVDEEKRAEDVERVKTVVLAEEVDKWDVREAKRRAIEEEERERLVAARRARGAVLGDEVWEFMDVYGLTGVGVVIGIAAFAGAIVIMMNSSR